MGIWRNLFLGPAVTALPALSWMSPQESLNSPFIPEDLAALLENKPDPILDITEAMRIPAFKRSYEVTCGVLARMPWVHYNGDTPTTEQPRWLINSQSGVSPRHLRYGVAGDMFAYGSSLIGFELGPDALPLDAMHIPFTMWELDAEGRIKIDARVPAQYRQRVVWIPLGYGSNGVLIDARDTIADARDIAAAYRDRIRNPIAQTVLSLAAERWDGWDKDEREDFRKMWVNGRKTENGSTAMKPDWVTVDMTGNLPADLFESGRNANRLDMANHAGLPASILEGAKQGGGGGDMHYSTEAGGSARNELWDYGLAKYPDAWDARLSLDDVCAPGMSIRTDTSAFLTSPNPLTPQTSED